MGFLSHFHTTWFDALLLLVIVLSIVLSFFRGFVKEAISLISWVLAVVLGLKLAPMISHHWLSGLASSTVAYVIAFVGVAVAVLLLGFVVSKIIKLFATLTGLGIFDRALGVIFGFVRGVLLATLMTMLVSVTALASSSWFENSAMKVALHKPEQWMQHFVPKEVSPMGQWAGDHQQKVIDSAKNTVVDRVTNHS